MKVKAGQDIEERAVILGRYILEHKATVRAAAKLRDFKIYRTYGSNKLENVFFIIK